MPMWWRPQEPVSEERDQKFYELDKKARRTDWEEDTHEEMPPYERESYRQREPAARRLPVLPRKSRSPVDDYYRRDTHKRFKSESPYDRRRRYSPDDIYRSPPGQPQGRRSRMRSGDRY